MNIYVNTDCFNNCDGVYVVIQPGLLRYYYNMYSMLLGETVGLLNPTLWSGYSSIRLLQHLNQLLATCGQPRSSRIDTISSFYQHYLIPLSLFCVLFKRKDVLISSSGVIIRSMRNVDSPSALNRLQILENSKPIIIEFLRKIGSPYE